MVIINKQLLFFGIFMLSIKLFVINSLFLCLGISQFAVASGTMNEDEVNNVSRVDATSENEKQLISKAAGLLADYEITAKKLIANLESNDSKVMAVNEQAKKLLELSETVIDSTQFRLPQCNEYLAKSLLLKNQLQTISHDKLEKDYHHDAALPKAAPECYHTKDLFVHPATVIVLTRDDPSLNESTKSSINAEISEVLGHLELVRQLVIY